MKKAVPFVFIFLLTTTLFWHCDSGDENSQTGNLVIQMTDAPFPTNLLARAEVTIDKIEVRRSGSEQNPYQVLSEEEATFNLLDLVNGVTSELVNLEIPVGQYDLIRLYIKDASVELSDGTTYEMTVPSGAQTGLKIFIKPSIEVVGGLTAELLLDFDVSRSFIPQGNMDTPAGIKGFNFSPVVKATNVSIAGRLVGNVTDTVANPLEGVTMSVFAADTLNTSTFTDMDGDYAILGLTAGTYDLVAEYEGFVSQTIEGIEITAANATTQNLELVGE